MRGSNPALSQSITNAVRLQSEGPGKRDLNRDSAWLRIMAVNVVFGFWIACADGVFYNIRVCFFGKKADHVHIQTIGITLCSRMNGAQKGNLRTQRFPAH